MAAGKLSDMARATTTTAPTPAALEKQLVKITEKIAAIDAGREKEVARQHEVIRRLYEADPKGYAFRRLGKLSGMSFQNVGLIINSPG